MTAQEYLQQYGIAERYARRCKREYEIEMEKIDAIGSTLSGDGMPHGSGVSRKTEDKAIRLAEKAEALKEAQQNAMLLRQEIFEFVHDIPGVEGDVLVERYLNFKHWSDIAEQLSYSERSIYIIHNRALEIAQSRMR